MAFFKALDENSSIPQAEERVRARWDSEDTFRRSIEVRPQEGAFIFYDGPPFATGLPHYGHLVASTIKDVVPRYWTMRGHRVERRFGWDTHGLPIEMDVERKLGISGPRAIREYGVARFNEECRAGVLRYVAEWEKTISRLGRWVDFRNDYKTMDTSFMESVWWVFRQIWDKGLVYSGHKVTPYSWRLSTPLSNFEAGLDYREVTDPAVTIRLALRDAAHESLLIWTTTPWTLPSNLAVAVNDAIVYAKVAVGEEVLWIAQERIQAVLGDSEHQILEQRRGSELVGRRYTPLFDYFADAPNAFQIVSSEHVATGEGTGLVHMAPAFGEDDYEACRRAGIGIVNPVDDEGNFTSEVPDFAGRNVKEADKDIIRALKARGAVFRHDTLVHQYPYCWRSGTPLIYRATPSWYVKAESLRERMVAANDAVHWVPDFVGRARFSNWLKEARDWSISRSRFWGTPLPVWVSEDGTDSVCIGSVEELKGYVQEEIRGLHPHEIDHLKFVKDGKRYQRIPEVFDCWFESGSMPYAQAHYPFDDPSHFERSFPAQFIAEGLDQTRGWFYTLMVLSTALFDKAPFRNVVVNGLVLAEDGSKMSKSKKNYPDPALVFDTYGADALRAYLISSPVVRGEPLRFSEAGVRDVVRSVLLPLQHALGFFVTYANLERDGRGWSPLDGLSQAPPLAQRSVLDRWILSILQSLIREVNTQMEGYYLFKVVPPMLAFIDDLTNWYIRRSRRRFWKSESDSDKAAAYATLYEVLLTFAKVLAPVMPFMAERMYETLAPGDGKDSVHLQDYPQVDERCIDAELEADFATVRQAVTLGRSLREKHKLKTRQPLRAVTVVSHNEVTRGRLRRHSELLAEELNVKAVHIVGDDTTLAELKFKPNFRTLGPRLGSRLGAVGVAIGNFGRAEWIALDGGGSVVVAGEAIGKEDVLLTRIAKGAVVLASEGALTVALDSELSPSLKREGLVREATRAIQQARAGTPGLQVSDRIDLVVATADPELRAALEEREAWIREETLAAGRFSVLNAPPSADPTFAAHACDLDGAATQLFIRRIRKAS